jgi:DNA replication protein DnaC
MRDIAKLWEGTSLMTQEQIEQLAAEEKAAGERKENQKRQGNFSEFLRQCGSESAKGYTFTAYDTNGNPYQNRCKDAVLDWAQRGKESLDHSRSLILHGPVGTGKDHLAIAACRSLSLRHGYRVGFLAVQDWFGRIRDAMDDNESERSIIGEASSPDVLVISDPLPPFGNLTQHQATMFYRLVERRSSLRRHNIVTINVRDDSEAYERLGAPTWNRLIEDALMIHCNWPSHRQPRQRITNVKVAQ